MSLIYSRIQPFLLSIKWVFTALALAFLIIAILNSRDVISGIFIASEKKSISSAIVLYIVAQLLIPLFAHSALLSGSGEIRYTATLSLYLRYIPARYLPGSVWHTVARVDRLLKWKVSQRRILGLVILENALPFSIAVTIGGIFVGSIQGTALWGRIAWIFVVAGCALIVFLFFALNRFVLGGGGRIPLPKYVLAVAIATLFWSCMVFSFVLFIYALPNTGITSTSAEIGGIYLFSWGIGFLTVFAPQGLGVFEVVASSMLQSDLAFEAMVSLILGFRVIALLGDIALWTGWSIQHLSSRLPSRFR